MEIDAAKLKRLIMSHVKMMIIDLRTEAEFQKEHIPGSVNFPASKFVEEMKSKVTDKTSAIVVYDADGTLSPQCAQQAEKLGYINLVCLEGGFKSFQSP